MTHHELPNDPTLLQKPTDRLVTLILDLSSDEAQSYQEQFGNGPLSQIYTENLTARNSGLDEPKKL